MIGFFVFFSSYFDYTNVLLPIMLDHFIEAFAKGGLHSNLVVPSQKIISNYFLDLKTYIILLTLISIVLVLSYKCSPLMNSNVIRME